MHRSRILFILSFAVFLTAFIVAGSNGLAWKAKTTGSEVKETTLVAPAPAPAKPKSAAPKRVAAKPRPQPSKTQAAKTETAPVAKTSETDEDSNAADNAEEGAQPDLTTLSATMVAATQDSDEPQAFPDKSTFIAKDDKKSADAAPDVALNPRQGGGITEDAGYLRFAMWSLVMLAVVIALGIGLKYLQAKGGNLPNNGKLKIVSQQIIGARSKVLIVEALGKRYLIGSTPERISLIADMDYYPDEIAEDEALETRAPAGKTAKADLFKDSFRLEAPDPGRIAGSGASQNQETSFREMDSGKKNAGAAARIRQKLKTLKKMNSGS